MSSTKIIVLQLKEIIYTLLFAIIGFILLMVLIFYFIPGKKESAQLYESGVYTAPVSLDYAQFNVSVVVEDNQITSVELTDFDDNMALIYPLVEPTMAHLNREIVKKQSLDVDSPEDASQTANILLDGIKKALSNPQN
ncbi:MAG TPA: hypothetical protein PLL17_02485 [Defluviitaleaceae bacterium]|nr:hypothetical protein [Candidatus Epulonipiscium sp.]HOQ16061.1 hypothetical protein [Defluviitaleaceae bacterium]HPT77446.1 hypothetical protein [Defluviitaleaceae bacterium]HQD49987.1 hypothetical protein [Defluviitaleaceae bacterium]